ncbi:MAG TPA: hypothetical protein VIY49_24870 [Bryobacteraceae bacterium]
MQTDSGKDSARLHLATVTEIKKRQKPIVQLFIGHYTSFMDIRLLASNPPPEAVTNHRTGMNITRAFFDARFLMGDQKDWATFEASPGEGIKVERLSGKP